MKEADKLINHLKAYRATNGLTQLEMSVVIGVSNRTYQKIEETGTVKKIDTLNCIKEKTGFVDTQKSADTLRGSGLAGEEIVKLKKETIKLQAFINILLSVVSGLSSKSEKKSLETKYGELLKLTDDEYDRLYRKYLKEQEREMEQRK